MTFTLRVVFFDYNTGKAQALVEWVQEECVGWQDSKVKRYDVGKFPGKEGGQDVCKQY